VANPDGIEPQSPRLPYSATLGQKSSQVQPRRGCGSRDSNRRTTNVRRCVPTTRRNPFGVVTNNRLRVMASTYPG